MARMRPVYYYERQAAEAQRRADYFRNRTPPAEPQSITSRGDTTELYYRSLIQKAGTAHLIYAVNVRDTTLGLVTAAQAGLKTSLGNGETALRVRGSGLKPTKVSWYKGRATAIRRPSAWQTSVSIYHQAGTHRSIPFSKATGEFTPDDVQAAFTALFGPTGSLRTELLGDINGRAHITWETASVSATT